MRCTIVKDWISIALNRPHDAIEGCKSTSSSSYERIMLILTVLTMFMMSLKGSGTIGCWKREAKVHQNEIVGRTELQNLSGNQSTLNCTFKIANRRSFS